MNDNHTLQYLIEAETTAAEVLSLKEEIFNMHRKVNECREALSELNKNKSGAVYMYEGSMLIKQTENEAIAKLKTEFKQLNDEIRTKGNQMRTKVNQLRDIEQQVPYSGTSLVPLDPDELKALQQLI